MDDEKRSPKTAFKKAGKVLLLVDQVLTLAERIPSLLRWVSGGVGAILTAVTKRGGTLGNWTAAELGILISTVLWLSLCVVISVRHRRRTDDSSPERAGTRRLRGRWISKEAALATAMHSSEHARRWENRRITPREKWMWNTPSVYAIRARREEWPRIRETHNHEIAEGILAEFAQCHPEAYELDKCRYHERTLQEWLASLAKPEMPPT